MVSYGMSRGFWYGLASGACFHLYHGRRYGWALLSESASSSTDPITRLRKRTTIQVEADANPLYLGQPRSLGNPKHPLPLQPIIPARVDVLASSVSLCAHLCW